MSRRARTAQREAAWRTGRSRVLTTLTWALLAVACVLRMWIRLRKAAGEEGKP